jgi:LysM repeat protein
MMDAYKKKRQLFPTVIAILAVLLVVIGIVIIVMWISGGGFSFGLFQREPTPTSTLPPTPVMSATPTIEPTETPTPTVTISPTPSGPFEYEIKQDDTCWGIANTFEVDLQALLAINNFPNGTCPIYPGQLIRVPAPGTTLPTPTPLPADLAAGTILDYTVQSGDTLQIIASKMNSTIEDITARNKFDDINVLIPGAVIKVRYGIVTPTPTFAPTSTLAP